LLLSLHGLPLEVNENKSPKGKGMVFSCIDVQKYGILIFLLWGFFLLVINRNKNTIYLFSVSCQMRMGFKFGEIAILAILSTLVAKEK
jgi:hypothetical protein